MKKLLFILSAILVSATGWAANNLTQANPFAYDLSSELRNNGNTLALTYTLNANAVTSNTYNTTHGVKINLIDEQQNSYTIRHITSSSSTCVQRGRRTVEIPISEIPAAYKDKPITWEIEVFGNKSRTTPKVVDNIKNYNSSYYPRAAHGIAVEKNPANKYFGKIFIAEACTNTTGKNSLLEYDMLLKYKTYHHKDKLNGATSHFSSTTNYEPHRVKISDDGRVFATCYHTTASDAVIEYLGNGEWNTIVSCGSSWYSYTNATKENLNRRIVDMDVKGSGDNLKIIAAWITPKNNQNASSQWLAKVEVREYEVGKNKTFEPGGGKVVAEFNDVVDNGNGLLYQAYNGATPWNAAQHGFIGIAYDKSNDNIWMRVDFAAGQVDNRRSQILYFDRTNSKTYKHTFASSDPFIDSDRNGYYGGNAFFVNGDILVTGCGTGHLVCFTGVNNFISGKTNALGSYTKFTTSAITGRWTNAIAEDYAGNLYVLTEDNDNVFVVTMPYDGKRVTRSKSSITVSDPVPNILATDLTYAPYGNENKYEFSFNVNTKPELAQICFYANEADMLANNGNYSFYYEFSEAELKQGRMSVIFDAVGGKVNNDKTLADKKLPRGEFYWNVYVKTRESNVFAPIYTQPAVGASDFHRQHATVDNNPDNKGFGHIYVADHHNIAESANREHYVRAYTIGNATGNAQQDNQSDINDNTRYTTCWQVRNTTAKYTRRPAVAPDGMIYITDEGANNGNVGNDITYGFVGAGMWVLDPNNQTNGGTAVWNTPNFSTKTPNQEVTTAASFLKKDEKWYLYKTNTYEEVTHHGPKGTNDLTTNAKWQANGYRIYTLSTAANGALVHSGYDDAQSVAKPFGGGDDTYKCGDTGGQFSILATENGVWMCQHREGKVVADDSQENPDGKNGVALSFFNHSGTRTFTSTAQSALTQNTSSPLQSTPGGGMAYQKRDGVEYLYLVNHAGNILEFEITGGTTPTLTHKQTYVTGNGTKGAKYGAISSMNFDYAGNLVVTIGATYGVNGTDVNGNAVVRDHQDLVIYTMPYPNQENARAIPAPKSCRRLPERIAYLGMDNLELQNIIRSHAGHGGCFIDFFRPLQAGMFNTICLPFNLNLENLPETNPLFNAIGKEFSDVTLMDMNGEKVLCLEFRDVTNLQAYKPYLIEPSENITDVIRFDDPIELTSSDGNIPQEGAINIKGKDVGFDFDDDNHIDFKGVVPITPLEATYADDGTPLTLLLVADNRLAALTSSANILGFRAYFQLAKPLPAGTATRIVGKKPVTTNTTIIVDGKKVNVEKFLREGRVYIRVGETLYNITGDKVMR